MAIPVPPVRLRFAKVLEAPWEEVEDVVEMPPELLGRRGRPFGPKARWLDGMVGVWPMEWREVVLPGAWWDRRREDRRGRVVRIDEADSAGECGDSGAGGGGCVEDVPVPVGNVVGFRLPIVAATLTELTDSIGGSLPKRRRVRGDSATSSCSDRLRRGLEVATTGRAVAGLV